MRITSYFATLACSLFLAVSFLVAPVASQAADPTPPVPLTEEAAEALTNAEARVAHARAVKGLWTTAQATLDQANAAVKKGDSAAVLKLATLASNQAFLGMAQLGYPLTDK